MRLLDFMFVKLFKIFNTFELELLQSFILYLSTKKLIKASSSKNNKNILILYRAIGIADVQVAFNNKKNTNFNFYFISRQYLRIIFDDFFSDKKFYDYHYKINKNLISSQKQYQKKLHRILSYYKKFFKLDCILSFNPFYRIERELQNVAKLVNVKFICMHKESVNSLADNRVLEYLYKNKIDQFGGDLILTYNHDEKEIILKSKFAKNNKVIVTGCARADRSFKTIREKKVLDKNIVFFLVEDYRGFPEFFFKNESLLNKKKIFKQLKIKYNYPKHNWNRLNILTVKYLIEYAKKNSEVNVLIKGKSALKYNFMNRLNLPKNCKYTNCGFAQEYIEKSQLIINFNSTVILEAMLANRNIIIPFFYKDKKRFEKNIINFDEKLVVYSKEDFMKRINNLLSHNNKDSIKLKNYKEILKKYIGNNDGKSSERVRKVFSNFLK